MQWHLRFSRAGRLEILLRPGDIILAREALFMEPGWELAEEREGNLALAVFTRR